MEISQPVHGSMKHVVHVTSELQWSGKEQFQLAELLGSGSFGKVYRGIHESGMEVAVKIVNMDASDAVMEEIQSEIEILKKASHLNVVGYFGVVEGDNDGGPWILMQYAAGGSVLDVMENRELTMDESEIARIMREVLCGLQHLHQREIVHRDLKAGNILLSGTGDVLIADFGVSKTLGRAKAAFTTVGTPLWMAPEIVLGSGHGTSADVWSLGITAIELADGCPPLAEMHPMRALYCIPHRPPPTPEHPERHSAEFLDFVAQCLRKDPKVRAGVDELLRHPYLSKSCTRDHIAEIVLAGQQMKEEHEEEKRVTGFSAKKKLYVSDSSHPVLTVRRRMDMGMTKEMEEEGLMQLADHDTVRRWMEADGHGGGEGTMDRSSSPTMERWMQSMVQSGTMKPTDTMMKPTDTMKPIVQKTMAPSGTMVVQEKEGEQGCGAANQVAEWAAKRRRSPPPLPPGKATVQQPRKRVVEKGEGGYWGQMLQRKAGEVEETEPEKKKKEPKAPQSVADVLSETREILGKWAMPMYEETSTSHWKEQVVMWGGLTLMILLAGWWMFTPRSIATPPPPKPQSPWWSWSS